MQTRSTTLNTRLDNRRAVEKLLGPAVEDFSISPAVVKKISEGPMDDAWILALGQVEMRIKAVEAKSKDQPNIQAVKDIRPLLEDLVHKA